MCILFDGIFHFILFPHNNNNNKLIHFFILIEKEREIDDDDDENNHQIYRFITNSSNDGYTYL